MKKQTFEEKLKTILDNYMYQFASDIKKRACAEAIMQVLA